MSPTRKFIGAVAISFACISVMVATPSAASAATYDGRNPYGTGCINGSFIAASAPLTFPGQANNGVVYLHYSPRCRTIWASIVGVSTQSSGNAGGTGKVHRNSDNAQETCKNGTRATSCYTAMLNDARTTGHAYGENDTGFAIWKGYTANF